MSNPPITQSLSLTLSPNLSLTLTVTLTLGDLKRTYNSIGTAYRKRGGALRKCPENKKEELTYLTTLVTLIIVEDQDTLGLNSISFHSSAFEYIRFLPTISNQYANPKGTHPSLGPHFAYPSPLFCK
jgi:hypothetical protein